MSPRSTPPAATSCSSAPTRTSSVHGIAAMSLRPLAREIGSSPRVLLYLFGSKDGLVRALLARARADELAALRERAPDEPHDLADDRRRAVEPGSPRPSTPACCACGSRPTGARSSSRTAPGRASRGRTVEDWLELLGGASNPTTAAQRTLALAVLRGAFLDLLASGDAQRTGAAVALALARSLDRERRAVADRRRAAEPQLGVVASRPSARARPTA